MDTVSSISRYQEEQTYVRWGTAGSFGIHLLLAAVILTVTWLTGVKSIEQLMKESGSLAMNPPPPDQQLEVELKDDLPPPPPTPAPEFIRQIEKPIPPPPKPIIIKKPIEQPRPRAVVSAPAMVSRLVVGSGNFPKPGYPYQALLRHEGGTVMIAIQFDSEGRVSDADVANSSGHPDLDSGASSFIRAHWHDPSFAGRSVTVPIDFVPQ
jgi:TonB family protein